MKNRVISGLRHRHRAAALDLPAEDRDHRARRAEDVAEANGDEARLDLGAPRERLDDPLAERLRLAHHVLRVGGLVGRDQDEPLDPGLDRDLGERPRRERRCSTPPAAGSPRASRRACTRRRGRRPAGGSARRPAASSRGRRSWRAPGIGGGEVALADELALDLEQRRLALVDQQQPRRAEPRELPAQLAADRAAGAGDEHRLVARRTRRRRRGRPRPARGRGRPRPAPAGSAREVEVAGDQLVQRRQRLDRDALRRGTSRRSRWRTRPTPTGSRSAPRRACCRGARAARSSVVPSTRTPCTRRFALARVVVDEADRRVVQLPVALHLAHQQLRRRRPRRRSAPPCRGRRGPSAAARSACARAAACRRRTRAAAGSRARRLRAGASRCLRAGTRTARGR